MSAVDWLTCSLLSMLLAALGALLISVLPTPEKSTVRTHFLLTFAVSLGLLTIYWNASARSGHQGFAYSDDETYHLMGKSIAESGDIQQAVDSADLRNPGFVLWTAYLYKIFGANTIVVRLFNIFFRGLWIVPIAFLCASYGDSRTTSLAVRLSAWAPSALLIGLLQVKDVMAILAFLSALGGVAYLRNWRKALPTLLVACMVMGLVRQDLMLLIFPFASIQAFRILREKKRMGVLVILLASAVGTAAFFLPRMLESWHTISGFGDVLPLIFAYTGRNADAANALAPFFILGLGDLWKLPFSMAVVMILPFPPDLSSTNIYLTANGFSSLFVLALFPFFLGGCWFALKKWQETRWPALMGILGCAALLAIMYPGAVRYREQLIGLFCVFAALGIRNWRPYRILVVGSAACIFFALIVGMALYIK